jgi:CDP-paratose 2-epimerase
VIGTFNMLDLTHRFAPDATFIFLSSSKVYGTAINADLREGPTRYRHELMLAQAGLLESQPVDQTIHTQYGASKLAADLMAQEFGWSYGMNVVVLRCGCITGPHHAGVSQHGFLSHLVKSAVAGKGYKIYGFGGKQVRDQIHAHDLATACEEIVKNPPTLQVFNLGGGPRNSISVIEAIVKLETILNREVPHTFFDEPRYADQVVVVNNIQRFRQAFPVWGMAYNVDMMLREMVEAEQS